MKFSKFSEYLEKLEITASRIEITKILSELLTKTKGDEIDKVVYLLLGNLAPRYSSVVFNIADKMMIQILASAYNKKAMEVEDKYERLGDLGVVAYGLAGKKGKVKDELDIIKVFNHLEEIAKEGGEGSQDSKINKSAHLLSKLDRSSAKFVVRITLGKLRLGFSDKTILDAISWMEVGSKSKKDVIESAYNVLPDVGYIAKSIKAKGVDKTAGEISPKLGIPVLPELAQRLKSPDEMIKKMRNVVVEPKFDGLRIQIHYKSGKNGFVKAYTRNLNETSWMFPELSTIGKQINADEVIIDTEGIGVDEERKRLVNFQQTMTRRRKHNIDKIASKVSIKFYVFDLLYKDGRSLMKRPYIERRKELEVTIRGSNALELVSHLVTTEAKTIKKEMARYIQDGLEGVIVKRIDSMYVAGRKGWRWVKMKEEESAKAKLADTIDCIVMGYFTGKGRRTKFGVGGFLVGVPKGEKIFTLTKIGTGLTDDQFRELKERLSKIEVDEKPKEYAELDKTLTPDVWVSPSLVVEIAADEITKSPKHSSGFALRFPRLVKFRDDKSWEQSSTTSELKTIFNIQYR